MSGFEKYQHVERFGTAQVRGIEDGECYVFPKIDGTNASVWVDDGEIQAGSRKRHLTVEEDNAGFCAWAKQQDSLKKFFEMFPELRLYGEWLVPHTLKTYSDSAWRQFYVFDVQLVGSDRHIHYEDYKRKLDAFGIEYIPPICMIKNPTLDTLTEQLEKNHYLIKDGDGIGEGVVVKRYDFTNSRGRQIWAKIVNNELKFKHTKVFKVGEIKEKKLTEESIINTYITQSLCEKEFAKITLNTEWESRMIPQLLGTIFYSLIDEEAWTMIKKFKYPTINFRTLNQLTARKVKELLPDIF